MTEAVSGAVREVECGIQYSGAGTTRDLVRVTRTPSGDIDVRLWRVHESLPSKTRPAQGLSLPCSYWGHVARAILSILQDEPKAPVA